jgi:hypothetical protein
VSSLAVLTGPPRSDIRQLTDVLHRNLQHYLPCNYIGLIRSLAAGPLIPGRHMTGISPSPDGSWLSLTLPHMRVPERTACRPVHGSYLKAAKVRGPWVFPPAR